ncbi:CRISPR-associated protein [Thermosediminibacter oceani]|uniref:CRISPR-associated protein, Csh2 family n=1 Tax=Thermosediminibacter oceani (strain ATCC BAA-1034 / DSM 16646 / JW/IW-1228P) TaxID=555079 RepID=D9RZG5_THEOJ|nr:type I CRISPR-associated protein Cas7 [Thermosediminibacter oceani]ADL06863.1 CRISPR-associated protein, Csh2 family [Thermosediminibacter oceani DSM 16646]
MPEIPRTGEILFIKCVKDGIPNRDPLNDSDARRIFGEDDGRISLSDVSIKRDVRDYIQHRFPDGGPDKKYHIFVRQEKGENGKLRDRKELARKIIEDVSGEDSPDKKKTLMSAAFDVRVFGAVYSVEKESFNQTGPVQFGWAHSLHPVETRYVQGTVVIPSEDASKGQGSIWTTYIVPFAVFCMPGVINQSIANETGATRDDIELLLEALWKGTLHRQARGRGIQQPCFLLHVEYSDPFFRIGYLEDYISLEPGREAWLGGNPPTSLEQVRLNVDRLAEVLDPNGEFGNKIERIRYWVNPALTISCELPGTREKIW